VTNLCHLEIGNLAEWVAAAAAVATAIIAGMALSAWRDQMRGTSRHMAAAEIAEATALMKYHFYDARNAFYDIAEFPPSYRTQPSPRSNADEFTGWAYVFQNRYSLLSAQILRLANLRAKAGALLSEECAEALEAFAKKGRELHGFFQDRLEQIRAGDNIVSQWSDQSWVQRVKDSCQVISDEHTDRYSLEFEEKLTVLKNLINPFI
jgi:hypothetical protein